MTSLVKGVVIVGAKRTPFGTYGGKLSKTHMTELGTIASKAALTAANVKPEQVDSIIFGNVLSAAASDGAFLPRHVGLKLGVPIDKPALTINRLCGSGFQSVVNAAQEISLGVAQIVLAGGVDNMSMMPYMARDIRFGNPLGKNITLEDSIWLGLIDSYCKMPMAVTAEKLGKMKGITRDQVDEYSLRSQRLYKEANNNGRFKEEIAPIPLKSKKDTFNFEVDEHPRDTSLDDLKKLKPLFQENGLVTAGTASGICDGAGAIVLASEEAATKNDLKPLARILSYSYVGVDPTIMGIGPVPAINQALKAAGKTLNDVDLVEINEAFAAQALACAKDLDLDMNKFNVDGGAIAIGHPLGASGSRITAHLVHELRRRKAKLGVGSACIGGGQGIAVVIEAL